jgi:hypothetical protein
MLVFMTNHYKWFFWCVTAGDPALSGAQILPLGYQRAYDPIIGFFGGEGIGFLLQQWINPLKYNEAGTVFFAIAIEVITLDILSSKSDLVAFFVGSEVVEYCYELFSGFRDISGLIRNQNVLCS